jgi:hypothetical protein
MKPEKEFKWLVILLNSQYIGGWIKKVRGGCKRDYEKIVGARENDSEFAKWFYGLVQEGCLVLVEDNECHSRNGYRVKNYVVQKKVLHEKFKSNPLYMEAYKVYNEDRII